MVWLRSKSANAIIIVRRVKLSNIFLFKWPIHKYVKINIRCDEANEDARLIAFIFFATFINFDYIIFIIFGNICAHRLLLIYLTHLRKIYLWFSRKYIFEYWFNQYIHVESLELSVRGNSRFVSYCTVKYISFRNGIILRGAPSSGSR